jgi:hypothetical protein
MSNYHVLNMNRKRSQATVVYHIPIPDEDNKAENTAGDNPHSYRTCLVEWLTRGGQAITTKVPNLETEFASEWADIQAGAIYEFEETNGLNANFTDAERFNKWNDRYTTLATREFNRLKKKMRLWGSDKNV